MNEMYIPVTDDYMFKAVFSDKTLFKELISRILPDVEVGEITVLETEETIRQFDETHGVRLDILAKTKTQMFNAEMQNNITDYPMKRARYSGDLMDTSDLAKGALYTELRDCYVIIIAARDPFGDDELVYATSSTVQKSGRSTEDGRHVIWVNCSGTKGWEEYTQLVPFCRYVMGEKTDDPFVSKIDEKVRFYSKSKEWRIKYMEWEQYRLELIQSGEKKGVKKERKEGIRKQYACLIGLGIEEEQAFQCVRDSYRDYSDKAIRKILSAQ